MGCSHQCRVCGGEDGRGLRWVCPVSYIALGVRFIPIKMIRHLPISLKTAGRKNTGTKKNLPSLEQGRLHPFDRNESKYCFLMPPELNVSAPQSPNRCLSIKKKKRTISAPFANRSPWQQCPVIIRHTPNKPPRSLHLTYLLLPFYPSCFIIISMKRTPRAFARLSSGIVRTYITPIGYVRYSGLQPRQSVF